MIGGYIGEHLSLSLRTCLQKARMQCHAHVQVHAVFIHENIHPCRNMLVNIKPQLGVQKWKTTFVSGAGLLIFDINVLSKLTITITISN